MAPPLKSLNMRVTSLETAAKSTTAEMVKSPFAAPASSFEATQDGGEAAVGAVSPPTSGGSEAATPGAGSHETCAAVHKAAPQPRRHPVSWSQCATAVQRSRSGRLRVGFADSALRGLL